MAAFFVFVLFAADASAQVTSSANHKPPQGSTYSTSSPNPQKLQLPAKKDRTDHEEAEHDERQDLEGPDFQRAREEWFFQPRTFPIGFIPDGARERARAQVRQMRLQQRLVQSLTLAPGQAAPQSGVSAAWIQIGPRATSNPFVAPFTSGRVTALAVDPRDTTGNTAFLGGADGGVWKTSDGGANWTPLFDFQLTTSIGAIAIDPQTPSTQPFSTVYVATGENNFNGDSVYGAGMYKSIDGGATWTRDFTFGTPSPIAPTLGGPKIGAIAIDRKPGSNNIVLAAVRAFGTALESGIWCSGDSGGTWTHVLPDVSGVAPTDVAFVSDGTAWAALGSPTGDATNNGIYKSNKAVSSCADLTTDATGSKWTKQTLPTGTPAASLGRIALAIAPSSNDTIYAAIADSTSSSHDLLGVIKTANATSPNPTWTQLTDPLVSGGATGQGFCNSQCSYDLAIGVHPADPLTVFAGGAANNATVIRTTDGGNSWSEVSRRGSGSSDELHVDTHAFAFNPSSPAGGGLLYVGNDGGVWSTANPAFPGTIAPPSLWSNLNQPLDVTQFYPGISIHPSTPAFGLGGTQDNGIQLYTGSLVWQDAGPGCDGGFTVIDPKIPTNVFSECQYQPKPPYPFLFKSIDGTGLLGSGHGTLIVSGIGNADRGVFIPPLVIDPNNSLTLYFATCRLWQTTDQGNSWHSFSPDLTTPNHAATCPVPRVNTADPAGSLTTVAVAPSDPNTIYTGSNSGEIEVTTNAGATWASLTTSTLPIRSITDVAVDPANSKAAYVTISGFGTCNNSAVVCDQKGHVFRTADVTNLAANPWIDISGNLADSPVSAIVIDPDDSMRQTLYIGADDGVFFTINGGGSWAPLGAPDTLPSAEVIALNLHDPSRTLRAATHGRGMWDINLGPGPNTSSFTLASISPAAVAAPSGSLPNFTAIGTGFTSNSSIQFTINGAPTALTTTPVSATQLTATIPSNLLQTGGVAQINVVDSSQNVSPTNALPFTILGSTPLVPDFALSVQGPGTVTVPAGQTATFTNAIAVAPQNGFTGSVNLTCFSPASATSCMIQPNPASFGTRTAFAVTATVTVTTMVRGLFPPGPLSRPVRLWPTALPLAPIVMLALALVALFARARHPRLGLTIPFAALLLILVLHSAGCSGGYSPPVPTGTPANTYVVTVTGASNGATHTASLTLIVQ